MAHGSRLARNPGRRPDRRRPREWHLYVVRTVDGCLYTGVTTDVKRRFAEHMAGGRRAARYLRAHRPAAIVLSRAIGTRSQALKAEYRFKQLTKEQKERAIGNAAAVVRRLLRGQPG